MFRLYEWLESCTQPAKKLVSSGKLHRGICGRVLAPVFDAIILFRAGWRPGLRLKWRYKDVFFDTDRALRFTKRNVDLWKSKVERGAP